MTTIRPAYNTPYIVIVNNGVSRSFTFNPDGTFSVPNNISVGNTSNAFRAIINAGNITGSDKTFSFSNRTGVIALEDATSLNAMLPSQTTHGGKVLSTDGAGNLSWVNAGTSSLTTLNGISTTTYNAQTFATSVTSGAGKTGPSFVSINNNVNTHTLNIPLASDPNTTLGGLLTNTEYGNLGKKDSVNTWQQQQTFSTRPIISTPGSSPSANEIATYGDVLAARNGVGLRPPVAALDSVTTGTGLPTSNPIIDGRTIQIGDRVLATALSGGNGGKVYKATGSIGSVVWILEIDGQSGDGLPSDGDIIFVKFGTNYADQQWAYNGTNWVLYNRSAAYNFSTGLTLTGTSVTVNFGSSAGTVCEGNDPRLTNARTPTVHQLDSATYHTISGKTIGQVVIATSASTFGFVTFSGDISSITAAGVVTIGKINNIDINELGIKRNSATLNDNVVSGTLVAGCSWPIASFRSVKIEYSISRGAGNFVTGYIVLMHDGTTPRITWIEDDSVGTHGITFSTDINASNMRLLYQTTSSGVAATMNFYIKAFPV